eukprot:c2964_g1_i1.p1 GENE.c2964_g1_i1~~c2964_g1_i1.p1  ORF type:complete len:418 (+),score=73.15 c2964_g1_i1:29-1255(+)
MTLRLCNVTHALIPDSGCDPRSTCLGFSDTANYGFCSCKHSFFLLKDSEDHQRCEQTASSITFTAYFVFLAILCVFSLAWIIGRTFLGYRRGVLRRDPLSLAVVMISISNFFFSSASITFAFTISEDEKQVRRLFTLSVHFWLVSVLACNLAILCFAGTVMIAIDKTINVLAKRLEHHRFRLIAVTLVAGIVSSVIMLILALAMELWAFGLVCGFGLILVTWVLFKVLSSKMMAEMLATNPSEDTVCRSAVKLLSRTTNAVLFTILGQMLFAIAFAVVRTAEHQEIEEIAGPTTTFFFSMFLASLCGTILLLTQAMSRLLQLRFKNSLGSDYYRRHSHSNLQISEVTAKAERLKSVHMFVVRKDSGIELFEEIGRRIGKTDSPEPEHSPHTVEESPPKLERNDSVSSS